MLDQTVLPRSASPVLYDVQDLETDEFKDRIELTYFFTKSADRKSAAEPSFSELANLIRNTTKLSKDQLPWLKLARFGDVRTDKGSLRHDGNVLAITGIEVDYDGPTEGAVAVAVDDAINLLTRTGIRSLVYTSPSHSENAPRWRILCPLSQEHAPEKRDDRPSQRGRPRSASGGCCR